MTTTTALKRLVRAVLASSVLVSAVCVVQSVAVAQEETNVPVDVDELERPDTNMPRPLQPPDPLMVPDGEGPSTVVAGSIGLSTEEAPLHEVTQAGVLVDRAWAPAEVNLSTGGDVTIAGLAVRASLGSGEVLERFGESLAAEVARQPADPSDVQPVAAVVEIASLNSDATRALGFEEGAFTITRTDDLVATVVLRLEFDATAVAAGRSMDYVHRLQVAMREDCAVDPVVDDAAVFSPCAVTPWPVELDVERGLVVAEVLVEPRAAGPDPDQPPTSTVPDGGEDDPPPSTAPDDDIDPPPTVSDEVEADPPATGLPDADEADPPATTVLANDDAGPPATTAPGEGDRSSTTEPPRTSQPDAAPGGAGDDAAGPLAAASLGTTVGGPGRVGGLRAGSGSGTVYYGLTAGFSSNWGSFAATPLGSAASWSVGLQTGSFDWSYPIAVVPTGWGAAPSVGVTYSSSAVDGVVSDQNTQSTMLGHGWNVAAGGFIERSYRTCSSEPAGGWIISDLCWFTNAGVYEFLTLNVGGRSYRLMPVSSTEWRAENDPNLRVTKYTGLAGSPDAMGDWFQLWTPDGSRHQFGHRADVASSIWTVPVYANQSHEPGYQATSANSWQMRGWRFNLDQVVDINGNEIEYDYVAETNRYARHGTPSTTSQYVRGGHLSQIRYGMNPTAGQTTATARIVFELENRCSSTNPVQCAWNLPGSTATPNWLDVPTDLECSTSSCTKFAPSFFTRYALAGILTQRWTGSGWAHVDRVSLNTEWPDSDSTGPNPAQLWLREIQLVGLAKSPSVTVPPIRFESFALFDNRADAITMPVWRVSQINDEMGGRTNVSYSPVDTSCPSSGWDANTARCFPRWTTLGGQSGYGKFNKYLVTQVERDDLRNSSPSQWWTYTYLGSPAWHHDNDPVADTAFRVYNLEGGVWAWRNKDITLWSDWRGYNGVRVAFGASGETQTVTENYFFRGMNGDRLAGGGTRSVTVTNSLGETFTDDNHRAGLVYEVRERVGSVVARYEFTNYWTHQPVAGAWFVKPSSVRQRTRTAAGSYIDTAVTSTYLANGAPLHVVEDGFVSDSADTLCVRHEYAPDNATSTTWLIALPRRVITRAGAACTSGTVLRDESFAYDGGAIGVTPTKGNLTLHRVTSSASTNLDTTFTYDMAGRPTFINAPLTYDDTTIVYGQPLNGLPTQTQNSLGHTVTTVYEVGRGTARTVTDPNGKTTTTAYDALGRPTSLTNHGDSGPTVAYQYLLSKTQHSWVRTSIYQNASTAEHSWVFYDGLGQPIESQRGVPHDPDITHQQFVQYNSRGLVTLSAPTNAYYAVPGAQVLGPTTSISEDRSQYDALGRPTRQQRTTYGVLVWETQISYDGFSTTVLSPRGTSTTPTRRTRSTVDARGNVVETRDYGTSTSSYRTTSYGYDRVGNLLTITDNLGNVTTMTYDRLGRVLTTQDPNAGPTTTTYDAGGRVVTNTTPIVTMWNGYDALGRQTERRSNTSTGTLRATWAYDAPGELGLPDQETAYNAGYPYTTDVTGYDARNRPLGTTYHIPNHPGSTNNGLAGSYTFTQTYDRADHIKTQTLPAVGGLAAETLTYGYHATGQLNSIAGLANYVSATSYDSANNLSSRSIGTGGTAQKRWYSWDYPARRIDMHAYEYGGVLTNATLNEYDKAGNVTTRTRADLYTQQVECFTYNQFAQLTDARTVSPTATCPAAPATATVGGYHHQYTYDSIGRITSFNRPSDPNLGNRTYHYGTSRPHAVTSTTGQSGTITYGYGTTGSRTSTSGAYQPPTTYTYDYLGRLSMTTQTGTVSTYEAELANRHVSTVVESTWCPCSAGKSIGGFDGSSTTAFVEWTVVVPTAGSYAVDFLYSAGDGAATRRVRVNGSTVASSANFSATTNWSTWATSTKTYNLVAGANTIRLDRNPTTGSVGWLNLDAIRVTAPSRHERYEAEHATHGGGLVVQSSGCPCHNNQNVGGIDHGAGEYIEWSVNAKTAGSHTIAIRYAGAVGDGRKNISVNGAVTHSNQVFASTGDWYVWNTKTFTVTLAKGTNRIRLGDPTSGTGTWINIDALEVWEHLPAPDQTWRNLYTTTNQRFTSRTPDGAVTLYLGNTELTATSTGVTARRTYTLDGEPLAIRDSNGLHVTETDVQNTITDIIRLSNGARTSNWYEPYGRPLATGIATTPAGYIAQPHDTNGLIYLNNRYYDSTLGAFISVDPLVRVTGQPYTYANANPATLSDPNGLDPCPKSGCSWTDSGGRNPCAHTGVRGGGRTCDSGFVNSNGTIDYNRESPRLDAYRRYAVWEDQFANPGPLLPVAIGMVRATMWGSSLACGGPICAGGIVGIDQWLAGAQRGEYGVGPDEVIAGTIGGATFKLGQLLGRWINRRPPTTNTGRVAVYDADFALGQITSGGRATASQLDEFGVAQGWLRSQTASGPIKYTDQNGVVRITIKQGSPRAPGSGSPHVEIRNADGVRVDPYGSPVTRRSTGNHTPIVWDLP